VVTQPYAWRHKDQNRSEAQGTTSVVAYHLNTVKDLSTGYTQAVRSAAIECAVTLKSRDSSCIHKKNMETGVLNFVAHITGCTSNNLV